MILDKSKQILIVGLGLIGGSYALALKKKGYKVNAIDIDERAIEYAIENNIIDAGKTTDYADLVSNADIIISCLYPTAFVNWVKANACCFKNNSLMTDVSGVKENVVDVIQSYLCENNISCEFIASHPMAGREVSGVWNSDDKIFKVANFIITPTDKNTKEGIDFANDLAKELGFANITTLSLKEHDEMIGYLSQLTHAIAVSLMNANASPNLKQYTGDSFRDLTRIAKINENLWSELFLLNKDILIAEISQFERSLDELKEAILNEDAIKLKELFVKSTARRKIFDTN